MLNGRVSRAPQEVYKVLHDADEHGAAVLGVPCKQTIKESEDGKFVSRTVERSRLWEVHTPQVPSLASGWGLGGWGLG